MQRRRRSPLSTRRSSPPLSPLIGDPTLTTNDIESDKENNNIINKNNNFQIHSHRSLRQSLGYEAQWKGEKHAQAVKEFQQEENQSDRVPFPSLKEIMVDDDDYTRFLKGGPLLHKEDSYHGGVCDVEMQVECARFCAGFSFVAILFLVLVGILIDRQPLYIKGIPLQDPDNYDMHIAAKNSFKTAAAYLLCMVLSLTYAHNHERFQWNILNKIKKAIHIRQHFAVAYSTYRRRSYSHIPDSKPHIPHQDANSVAPDLPTFEDILSIGGDGIGGGRGERDEINGDEQIPPSFELWKKVHHLGNIMSANLEKAKRR